MLREVAPIRRIDSAVRVHAKGERHVGARYRLTVMPASARIEMKRQRQRTRPLPFRGELRFEALVANRIRVGTNVGELEEKLVKDLPVEGLVGHHRQQRRRPPSGASKHERSAVCASTAAPMGATRDQDDRRNSTDRRRTAQTAAATAGAVLNRIPLPVSSRRRPYRREGRA